MFGFCCSELDIAKAARLIVLIKVLLPTQKSVRKNIFSANSRKYILKPVHSCTRDSTQCCPSIEAHFCYSLFLTTTKACISHTLALPQDRCVCVCVCVCVC